MASGSGSSSQKKMPSDAALKAESRRYQVGREVQTQADALLDSGTIPGAPGPGEGIAATLSKLSPDGKESFMGKAVVKVVGDCVIIFKHGEYNNRRLDPANHASITYSILNRGSFHCDYPISIACPAWYFDRSCFVPYDAKNEELKPAIFTDEAKGREVELLVGHEVVKILL